MGFQRSHRATEKHFHAHGVICPPQAAGRSGDRGTVPLEASGAAGREAEDEQFQSGRRKPPEREANPSLLSGDKQNVLF